MPGIGPPPQHPDTLVGHGAQKSRDNVMTLIPSKPAEQPPLPAEGFTLSSYSPETGWSHTQVPWPERTRAWWKMWGESPLMKDATETDWSELMDAAIVHARHWTGDPKAAAELRLRTAKFGATPEDRARLRIQMVAAKKAETGGPPPAQAGQKTGPRKLVG